MTRWIQTLMRKLFQKPTKEDEKESLAREEDELSSPITKLLKEKRIPERSISEYLAEHPQKEKLFLEKMKQEWDKSEPEPVPTRWLRLAFPSLVFSLALLLVAFYFRSSETPPTQSVLPQKLEIQSSGKKAVVLRSEKVVTNEGDFQSGDLIRLTDSGAKVQLQFGKNLHFELIGSTDVQIQSLPGEKGELLSLFIHKGTISIDSLPGQKPKIEWVTKNFQYVPTGTKASLVVNAREERLEVQEGSFRRTDRKNGKEKEILAGSSIRFSEPQVLPKTPEKYYLPGTIHLKNGKTYTGYYFQEKGKVIMKANNDFYEWSDMEVDFIE